MIWLFTGLALMGFLSALIAVTQTNPQYDDLEFRLAHEKHLRALGATEEQVREAIRQSAKRRSDDGPPVALGLIGLVPTAVGAAYLLFYRAEQKRTAQT